MMTIDTFSDLLNDFVNKLNKELDAKNIKHPTTIGSMYEGLSKEILQDALFKGVDLRVITNSFIKDCNTEFDVMIVESEGEKIPYTDRYIYPANQIIAVVQVKKQLYEKDLTDSYKNMQFIVNHYDNINSDPWKDRMFINAFRGLCGKTPDAYKDGNLNACENAVYHTLRCESILPLRIVWGYNGYKSEKNLRDAFAVFLNGNISSDQNMIKGFGPNNFPNLIICGDCTVIKMDGMPFYSPMDEEGWWPLYVTSHYNKMRFLLEAIWTRLSYKYSLPQEIFGEDLQKEPASIFLSFRYKKNQVAEEGWEVHYWPASDKQLKQNTTTDEWHPVEIDIAQLVVLNKLGDSGAIDLVESKELEEFVIREGYNSLEDFIRKFCETRLVCREGDKLKYLTDKCVCVNLKGKWYAADNKDNRLQNWAMKQIKD